MRAFLYCAITAVNGRRGVCDKHPSATAALSPTCPRTTSLIRYSYDVKWGVHAAGFQVALPAAERLQSTATCATYRQKRTSCCAMCMCRRVQSALLDVCKANDWLLLAPQLPGRAQRRKEQPLNTLQVRMTLSTVLHIMLLLMPDA